MLNLAKKEKNRREERRAKGLCTRCGKNKGSSLTSMCEKCKAKKKEYVLNLSKEKKRQTLDKHNEWNRNQRAKKKASGICIKCMVSKAEKNKSHCSECLEKNKKARQIKKQKGECHNCSRKALKGKTYCRKCFDAMKQRQRQTKLKAIEVKGGKCSKCNLVASEKNAVMFDFHHREGSKKEFSISKLCKRNGFSDKLTNELKKCVLLCSNCHRMRHALTDKEWKGWK